MKWATHAARAALLCVYVAAFLSLPTSVFWHPDEGGKFLALLSLRWDSGLQYVMPYGGRAIDPDLEFYATRCTPSIVYPSLDPHGTLQFRWPIWFPLLSRPLYDAWGLPGLYILPLVCGWLIAVFAGRWAALYDPAMVPLATLLIGGATPVFFYSLSFSEHTLATLCGVIAITAVLWRQQAPWVRLATAAAALLAAAALRPEMVALAPAIVLAALLPGAVDSTGTPGARTGRWRRQQLLTGMLALLALGFVAAVLAPAVLPPRYSALAHGLPTLIAENFQKLPAVPRTVVSVFMAAPDPGLPGGIAGQVAFGLAIVAAIGAAFVRRTAGRAMLLGAAFVVLEFSVYMALTNRPYLSRQGALAVAPFIVVAPALAGLLRGRGDRRLGQLYVAGACYAAFGFLALLTTRVTPQGDFPIGLDGSARYLLTLYPIAAVLALGTLSLVRRSAAPGMTRSGLTVLVTAGVVVAAYYQYLGVQEMRANKEKLVQWEAVLGRQERVVTDVWWLPACLAPFYASHELYCIDAPGDLATWIERAHRHRIAAFAVATTGATTVSGVRLDGRAWNAVGCETVAGLQVCRFAARPEPEA